MKSNMKRIFAIATLVVATLAAFSSCTPQQEEIVALTDYMDLQEVPGVYTYDTAAAKGKALYTFSQSDGQGYFNKSKLTYRIMNNEGNKYVQFILSAEPEVDSTVDVKMTSKGLKEISSNVTYKAMKVERMEGNLLYLIGGAETKYTALILVWIE